jgi:hypothetical protein
MTKDEALKLALEALEDLGMKHFESTGEVLYKETFTAIKEALAQPEQEPVAFINVEQRKLEWAKYMSWDTPTVVNLPKIPLYTALPHSTWVGLTEAQCGVLWKTNMTPFEYYQAIEAKLKEKNS